MAKNRRLIAVPTAYNIYQVTDDVLQMHKAEMMAFPTAVVLETLVLQGLAKLVARIKPFDTEDLDDDEELEVPEAYREGDVEEQPSEDEPLPGPWFPRDDEDDENE